MKRPLYAKDLSPLNVEPKVKLLLGLWFWFSWGSCNRAATASTYRRWSARRNVQRCYRLVFHQWFCCFIAERASSLIRFNDLEGKVIVKPGSLKNRADPLSQLPRFILPLDGTVSVLRKRLNTHLQNWVAKFGNLKPVQVRPPSEKPTSICAASENILCADDVERGIKQVKSHYNRVGIAGTGVKLATYPTRISNVISMEFPTKRAYFQQSL